MQDVIERTFLEARQHWSGLERVTLGDYSAHVTTLATTQTELERHGADLYLALACGVAEPAALRILEDRFFPAVDEQLSRAGFDESARKDVFQQMMMHLCAGPRPRILTYAGRAGLSSWLRVTAMRFALNMQASASHGAQRQRELADRLLNEETSPERHLAAEKARPLFQSALEEAIRSISDRDRTLLRLCFVDGLTVDAIGSMYGVHRATAARWIADIRRRVLQHVRSLLAHEPGLHASEFESLARLVRSELHLTLKRVLGAA
ncbi:MAG: sigma-70 family RNA polymerase sigma factor [Polyangiaceae bacterium]|nr:sigma-70 family RNA polymerase sigma factor [Polyangiaceae bacterium]